MNECMCKTCTKSKKCVINYIFYLSSIERFETLTIQKYKNVFYQQGREIVILKVILKVILIYGGCEKVIWAGGRRKVNGVWAEGREPGLGAVGQGKVILFYLQFSCRKVVEKSNKENLKVIRNTFPNKSGNPEHLKK